jgi:hypothetical protein
MFRRDPPSLIFDEQLTADDQRYVNLTCLPSATFPSDCPDGGWGVPNQQLQSLSFDAVDRPACPYCGERMYLTRRTPHPDHDLRYELQIFTCSACDHTIERIVDANGNPPAELKCCD